MYPEHEKLKRIKVKSQAIGEFLDWLDQEKNLELYDRVRECPANIPIQDLLAEYFDIDRGRLEEEKLAMLEELRK